MLLSTACYLDKIMAPIVRSLPSYVKDSQHALQIFRDFNFLGEGKLMFTMDITSFYTVIPNGEGLLALKHFFDLRTVKEPSSETLLRLAELVLTLNCFSFADSYYKQIKILLAECCRKWRETRRRIILPRKKRNHFAIQLSGNYGKFLSAFHFRPTPTECCFCRNNNKSK